MTPKLKEVQAFFELLNKNVVEYMIIGGVAVNVHGYTRATGDLDIWYNPTDENASKDPLKAFIRIPLESFYIELLAIIDGKLNYYEVYNRAYEFEVNDKLTVKVIGYDDLIQNKIMT